MHLKKLFRGYFIMRRWLSIAICCLAAAFNCWVAAPAFAQDYTFSDAVSAYKSGQYDTALKICDSLPYETKIDLLRGYVYLAKSDTENAERSFENTLNQDRFYTLADYALYEIIKINYYAGKFDAVVESGNEFVANYPTSPLLPETKKLTQLAQEKGGKAEPYTPTPFLHSTSPSVEGQPIEVATPEIVAGRPSSQISLQKSPSAGTQKLPTKTSPHVTQPRLNSSAPSSAEILFNKGMELFDSQDYGPAQTIFKQVMRKYPKSRFYDDALLMVGRCDFRMGKYKAAQKTFRKVVKMDRDTADDAQFYLGFVYAKQGNLPRALKAFKAVVHYFPQSELADDAQFYVGYYYEVDDQNPAALAAYGKLLKKFKHSDMLDDVALKVGMQQYSKGDYVGAYQTFKLGVSASPNEDFVDACLFWQAKSAQKLGNVDEANELFLLVTKNYDHAYYAFRAKDILSSTGVVNRLPALSNIVIIEPSYFPKNKSEEIQPLLDLWKEAQKNGTAKNKVKKDEMRAQRFNELVTLGQFQSAAKEIIGSSSKLDQQTLSSLGILLAHVGEYAVPVKHFDKVIRNATTQNTTTTLPDELWIAAYPLAYWPEVKKQAEAFGVDPYLVLAIMREESRFTPNATSRAYARGLMQIMSRTGKKIAKKLDIDAYSTKRLYEPELNIKMGTFYISQVLQGFSNEPALALAGYNGGPGNVVKWSKSLKIQKSSAGQNSVQLDIDEFIEHIPYRETRNYVKRVLKSYYEYKRIYGQK